VAPAGDEEVVVAVQAQLDRAASARAASAATQANSADCDSLPPKPPPMRRHSTCTSWRAASACATRCCISLGCWVEQCTSMPPSSRGIA
jgi:hypothetical protein